MDARPAHRPAAGPTHRRPAFTIIEMLVVIAMIMVLLALLLPALSWSREAAQRAVCAEHIRQMSVGWMTYPNDNDDRIMHGMPRNLDETVGGVSVGLEAFVLRGDGEDKVRQGRLYEYVTDVDAYRCPSEQGGRNNPDTALSTRSYSIIQPLYGEGWTPGNYNYILSMTQIRSPSRQLVWMEENDYRSNWNVGSWILGNNYQWVDYVARFHGNIDNIGFADGHMETVEWRDERTILQSKLQIFGQSHPGSVDWEFMNSIYRPQG